jgi:hypothetical protein
MACAGHIPQGPQFPSSQALRISGSQSPWLSCSQAPAGPQSITNHKTLSLLFSNAAGTPRNTSTRPRTSTRVTSWSAL